MTPDTLRPDADTIDANRLAFAKAWMQRKRAEQQQMAEEASHNEELQAAFEDLDRKAADRGSRIIEL